MPTLTPGRSLADVAEIIHAATVLGPAAWSRAPMPEAHMAADIEDRLKSHLISLFEILHQRNVPYVLVGGIAMLTYIEGRNTKDVDLVISLDSLATVPEIVIYDQNRDFARGKFGDLLVDLRFTNNTLFKLIETKFATTHRFLEMDIRAATIEGLILLKMYALPALYLQGRWEKTFRYEADIAILYTRGRPNMEPLFNIIKPYVTDGQLTDLRSIVSDIHRRIERAERAQKSGEGAPLSPPEP
jgi:hypothetical protein